jgi:hypothetical protein
VNCKLPITPHIGSNDPHRGVTIIVNWTRVGSAFAFLVLLQAAHSEDFVGKKGGIRIGSLNAPAGFKVENYDYREGVVTTLAYQDGSRIMLQSGGMYSLPLFWGAQYILISSTESAAKIVRVGRSAKGDSCWREDSYRPKKAIGPRFSLLALFPPNVGYSRVPTAQRSVFDRAFDSFIREIDRRPPAGR